MTKNKSKSRKKELAEKIKAQNRERSKRMNERRAALAALFGFSSWSTMMTKLGKFITENIDSTDVKSIMEILRKNVV